MTCSDEFRDTENLLADMQAVRNGNPTNLLSGFAELLTEPEACARALDYAMGQISGDGSCNTRDIANCSALTLLGVIIGGGTVTMTIHGQTHVFHGFKTKDEDSQ